ncbi:hypothetical protein [Micromonospora coxensis]|uniref:hypothetical protein n=1 Tax=Micromonospora coxensis TaxID=356852 RepID=UPI0012FD2D19|nr:hypothetical protein [Micromonospora coxensis]
MEILFDPVTGAVDLSASAAGYRLLTCTSSTTPGTGTWPKGGAPDRQQPARRHAAPLTCDDPAADGPRSGRAHHDFLVPA